MVMMNPIYLALVGENANSYGHRGRQKLPIGK